MRLVSQESQLSQILTFSQVEPQEDESVKNNPSVKSYFMMAPSAKEKRARASASSSECRDHPYFKDRGLRDVSEF